MKQKQLQLSAINHLMQEYTRHKLEALEPISLDEMDNVKLMNRTDTKCIFSVDLLNQLLDEFSSHYRVLFHAGTRAAYYRTLYFDTPELKFYKDHHNGREKRFKLRIRNYVESNLNYLEIKHKRYGRTDKKRIITEPFAGNFGVDEERFIYGLLEERMVLKPVMWNNFHRITLVNKFLPERVTIDLDLTFEQGDKRVSFDRLIIGEIKQERVNYNSPILNLLKKSGVRPSGMSKYCLGIAVLQEGVKKNTFKERILSIKKIEQNIHG